MTVSAVLLAAGASSRFGENNKLLADVAGMPLIRHVALALTKARLKEIVVVVQSGSSDVREALDGLNVHCCESPQSTMGMAHSIRAGISALGPDANCAMIVLGDMPGLTTQLIEQLVSAFESAEFKKIIYPIDQAGKQGHPVIWPKAYFSELMRLNGDRGAKELLQSHADQTITIMTREHSAFTDIDTPEDIEKWRRQIC